MEKTSAGVVDEASGSICYAEAHESAWPIRVKLTGLAPEKTYWLSVNCAIPGSEECRVLCELTVPGYPPGKCLGEEGYWDFKKVRAAQGHFAEEFRLPLPPGQYRVKLLVKRADVNNWPVVLRNDDLIFEVAAEPWLSRYRWSITLLLFFAVLVTIIRWRLGPRPQPVSPAEDTKPKALDEVGEPPVVRQPEEALKDVARSLLKESGDFVEYDFDKALEQLSDRLASMEGQPFSSIADTRIRVIVEPILTQERNRILQQDANALAAEWKRQRVKFGKKRLAYTLFERREGHIYSNIKSSETIERLIHLPDDP